MNDRPLKIDHAIAITYIDESQHLSIVQCRLRNACEVGVLTLSIRLLFFGLVASNWFGHWPYVRTIEIILGQPPIPFSILQAWRLAYREKHVERESEQVSQDKKGGGLRRADRLTGTPSSEVFPLVHFRLLIII